MAMPAPVQQEGKLSRLRKAIVLMLVNSVFNSALILVHYYGWLPVNYGDIYIHWAQLVVISFLMFITTFIIASRLAK